MSQSLFFRLLKRKQRFFQSDKNIFFQIQFWNEKISNFFQVLIDQISHSSGKLDHFRASKNYLPKNGLAYRESNQIYSIIRFESF